MVKEKHMKDMRNKKGLHKIDWSCFVMFGACFLSKARSNAGISQLAAGLIVTIKSIILTTGLIFRK